MLLLDSHALTHVFGRSERDKLYNLEEKYTNRVFTMQGQRVKGRKADMLYDYGDIKDGIYCHNTETTMLSRKQLHHQGWMFHETEMGTYITIPTYDGTCWNIKAIEIGTLLYLPGQLYPQDMSSIAAEEKKWMGWSKEKKLKTAHEKSKAEEKAVDEAHDAYSSDRCNERKCPDLPSGEDTKGIQDRTNATLLLKMKAVLEPPKGHTGSEMDSKKDERVNIRAQLTERKPDENRSDDSEEAVETITNHVEHHDGSWEFKISWEGYGSEWDLWYDEEDITHCKDLITRYKDELENKSEVEGELRKMPCRKPITVDQEDHITVNDGVGASGENDHARNCRRAMTFHHIEKAGKRKDTNKLEKVVNPDGNGNLILPSPPIHGTSMNTRERKNNLRREAREVTSTKQVTAGIDEHNIHDEENPTEDIKKVKTSKPMGNCNEEENQNDQGEDEM